ncbi:MAG TPA: sulfotransferase [Verrucomicrobiae bacterium]|nr:sulfotransferase [Verrucomicrobiae bacterium]
MIRNSEAAWARHNYEQAIEILEQAGRLAPNEPHIWLYLGRCHGMRYDYVAAERYFEKAVRVEGWKTESFLKAGRYCLSFRGYEMAARLFERALKRDEKANEILVELARIYLRQGRLHDATGLLDRASQLNHDFTPMLLVRARLHRLAGQLEEAEKILRSFVTRPEANGWVRAEGWYELGSTLDRQGRYDEAMKAFLEAKSVKLPVTAPPGINSRTAEAGMKQMVDFLSTGAMQHWREPDGASPQRRLALLCGHPRSGTTLLEQVLDSHPEIVSAEETQIFYEEAFVPFTRGLSPESISLMPILESVSPERLRRAREDYFGCIERFIGQAVGARLLIDKNPSLTSLLPAFIRVFPEARFLIAIRDPRDVCLSCFMQPLFPTTPSSSTYSSLEAAAAEYTSIMGLWQALKPHMPCPFLEVRYEEVTNNLEPVARRTLEFLGVPWDKRVLTFQQHTRKLVRSPTYGDVKKPISRGAIGRWRHYQKYFEPHLEKLEPFVKAFGYG